MTVQMKPHTFNCFGTNSIVDFQKHFKLRYDIDSVHQDEVIRLFHFFMNKIASVVINARLSADRICEK